MSGQQQNPLNTPYELLELEGGSPDHRADYIQGHLQNLWSKRESVDWDVEVVSGGVFAASPQNPAKPIPIRQPAILFRVSVRARFSWNPIKTVAGGLASLAMDERRMCLPLKNEALLPARIFIANLIKRINGSGKPTAADARTLAQMVDYDFYTR